MKFRRLSCALAITAALTVPAVVEAGVTAPPPIPAGTGDALFVIVFGVPIVLFAPGESSESLTIAVLGFSSGIPPGPYDAWLLEPVTLLYSDQIHADVGPNSISVTLSSDPLGSDCPDPIASRPSAKCLEETGDWQDVTTALFGLITAPVSVFAFSDVDQPDIDVPAPGSLALLGLGLAGVGLARRRTKIGGEGGRS
jgi:PEP-CTERM motif-containing protein